MKYPSVYLLFLTKDLNHYCVEVFDFDQRTGVSTRRTSYYSRWATEPHNGWSYRSATANYPVSGHGRDFYCGTFNDITTRDNRWRRVTRCKMLKFLRSQGNNLP